MRSLVQSKIFGTVNINSLNTDRLPKWWKALCPKFGQPCATFHYALTSDQGLTKLQPWW